MKIKHLERGIYVPPSKTIKQNYEFHLDKNNLSLHSKIPIDLIDNAKHVSYVLWTCPDCEFNYIRTVIIKYNADIMKHNCDNQWTLQLCKQFSFIRTRSIDILVILGSYMMGICNVCAQE